MCFCYFVIISPGDKAGSFIWTNLNPLYKSMHCATFGWNWPISTREFFLISSLYFHYFEVISPLEIVGPFIWTNLNLLYPRMFWDKFGWNWSSGSGEEDENLKRLRQRQRWRQQRRRTTDKFWSEKLTWAFGSGELWTWNGTNFIAISHFLKYLSIGSNLYESHDPYNKR